MYEDPGVPDRGHVGAQLSSRRGKDRSRELIGKKSRNKEDSIPAKKRGGTLKNKGNLERVDAQAGKKRQIAA